MQSPTISYLTKVQFGAGSLNDLTEVLQQTGIQKPLVVTDAGLLNLGYVDRLGLNAPTIYCGVPANPTETCVMEGAEVYRTAGCDGIIGLGGGSPIDAAKAIGLMATHSVALEATAYIDGGLELITRAVPPLVAIPTTAGTGTEVGRAALISMNSGRKLAIISPYMIPAWSIVDPEMTLGLPPLLTAATGLDALSHCLETYCSNVYNPIAGAIAMDGFVRGWRNLPTAVRAGDNIDARTEMMMCAMQGALAFQKGLGLIHAMSHPLGAVRGKAFHHGTLNSVLMPHIIRYNQDGAAQSLGQLADAVGVTGKAAGLASDFTELSGSLGIQLSLSDKGAESDDLDGVAQAAMQDHCGFTNPRAFDLQAVQELLELAM